MYSCYCSCQLTSSTEDGRTLRVSDDIYRKSYVQGASQSSGFSLQELNSGIPIRPYDLASGLHISDGPN